MQKLTQEYLEKLIAKLVPEQYQAIPKGQGHIWGSGEPPYVTNYTVQTDQEFEANLARHKKGHDPTNVMAFRLNWGLLKLACGDKDWNDYTKYASIYFREGEGRPMLGLMSEFVLLHEVGHVDWDNRYEEIKHLWTREESELYADIYAAEKLNEHYGDNYGKHMLSLFGSGWKKVKMGNKYDA